MEDNGADSIKPLPQERVGPKQAARNGFATLPQNSSKDFRRSEQTLCIIDEANRRSASMQQWKERRECLRMLHG